MKWFHRIPRWMKESLYVVGVVILLIGCLAVRCFGPGLLSGPDVKETTR